jgi:hypothetical protein
MGKTKVVKSDELINTCMKQLEGMLKILLDEGKISQLEYNNRLAKVRNKVENKINETLIGIIEEHKNND